MPTLRQQFKSEYQAYCNCVSRCVTGSHPKSKDYKGRGIELRFDCFEDFLQELGPRPDGYDLDRIDNDGHYEPGNVRWVTRQQNLRNRRSNKPLTYKGMTMLQCEWAEALGIKHSTLKARLQRGWTVEQALSCHTQARSHSDSGGEQGAAFD